MSEHPPNTETLDVLTKRVGVLRRLADAPAHKRDLVDELDQSRSTINRAIGDLEAANLVERTDDGFAATTAGRLALDRLGQFQSTLDDITTAETVLAPLPTGTPITTEVVAGSDAILASEPAPYQPLERFHEALESADRYRAVLPALDDPRHVRLLYEHVVTRDRPAELVVSPALLDTLRSEFPRRMAAMAETEGFEIHTGDVPPFALALVEAESAAAVYLIVFSEHGAVHGSLVNGSDAARRWAEDRYRGLLEDATDRTDVLVPDPDGGRPAVDAHDGAIRGSIGRSLPITLEREGFVRLDLPYFRDEPVAEPTTAWRAGLSLPEVHTGYAIQRPSQAASAGESRVERGPEPGTGQASGADEDPGTMVTSIQEHLEEGTDSVVVGPPGSGKSTVCKQVACEWYDADRGPVLYREQGRGSPFDSVADLLLTVDAAEGQALVVVEDAVRPEADAVFDAIARCADRSDVSFLLDARETEWRDPPGDPRDVTGLQVRTVPELTDSDARQLIEHVERTVGEPVDVSVDRLRDEIRDETAGDAAAPAEMLLLLHRLATYVDPLDVERTSLEDSVTGVYDDLATIEDELGETAGDELALDVGVLANVLIAAGIELDPGLLYAVADPGEYDAVDAARDALEGQVLFLRADGPYRTVHESWSATFLDTLLEIDGETAPAERFGRCVTSLCSLADDPDRRERIASHVERDSALASIESDPRAWADNTVEAVYAMAQERPKLAPLFGDGERDTVELPAACSEAIRDRRPVWLGRFFFDGGFYDRAERAFERLPLDDTDRAVERLIGIAKIADERGEYDDAVAAAEACLDLLEDVDRPLNRARAKRKLGMAKSNLGQYEAASEALRTSLEEFRAAGDRRLTADTLQNMGKKASKQGEYDRAREHFQRALEIRRTLGDRQGEIGSLLSLGDLARLQGEYETAREYLEQSLELVREHGDRQGEADTYNNLGIVAALEVEYDRALQYFERSLEIKRDLADRQGQANTLHNLGNVARRLGEYGRSLDYFERALEIKREMGNRQAIGTSLENLGELHRRRGEYDRARERHERSLDIARDLDYRPGLAENLGNLGEIDRLRGEFDRARDRLERALDLATDLGDPTERCRCHSRLGQLARQRDDLDEAHDHVEAALAAADEGADPFDAAQARLARGELALDCGDPALAREDATAARETFETMDSRPWIANCRRLLGRVAAADGDGATARNHWLAAIDTFEAVGAMPDALATLRLVVDDALERDDREAVGTWIDRAQEALADAPEPVADRHGEWVQAAVEGAADD